MSNIAIVAIPAEDDPVWKYSSEKVPHMTLLFLGEGPLSNEENVVQYIQHVADETLCKFGVNVDHRGALGPDDADVLFFDTDDSYGFCKIEAARGFLLDNDNIKEAYDGTEQYEGWTPHLTMGYPATPAKVDDREYPGFSYVRFDRIAIWLDDYDGPEFLLKKDDYRGEVMPSAYQSAIDKLAEDTLAHFGRKGMKWGVRRPTNSSGLVEGSVSGAIRGGQTPHAKAALKALTKGKASSDHKTFVKNIDKNVERLSTSEIRELTARIQAIKSFHAETAAQKQAKKSTLSKLVNFALNSAQKGATKEIDKTIQKLTGQQVKGLLEKAGVTTDNKSGKKSGKKSSNKSESTRPTEPDSSTTQERQLAIETLAAQIARQNG